MPKQGLKKKLEFQFVFWASNSYILFAQNHFFLVLVYDFIRVVLPGPYPGFVD